MTQNTSSAVMQQRQDRAPAALDDFPTPPWATRALYQHVLLPLAQPHITLSIALMLGWEPACNRGHMLKVMREYGAPIIGSDVHDYGDNHIADFLIPGTEPPNLPLFGAQLIASNPPFVQAVRFIKRARDYRGNIITAMLVRTSFLEGAERYTNLYRPTPPTFVCQFAERVVMLQGVLRDPDIRYWDATMTNPNTKQKTGWWRRPSTATSYCWLVWVNSMTPQPFVFIPPCRRLLTRAGDYPVNPDQEGVFTPPQEGSWLTDEDTATTPTTTTMPASVASIGTSPSSTTSPSAADG